MENIKIGIIGGTGVYDFKEIKNKKEIMVETSYGDASVSVGELHDKKVAFMARHGKGHSIAPGNINYRANIAALKQLGVRTLIATACSGSINPKYGVGNLVLIEQFLEFTKNRKASFFTDGNGPIGHIDNTEPYCSSINEYVLNAAKNLGIDVKKGATYCCTEGPRFESKAEIQMFRALNGDLVGHTNYPEVVLAREAEMCYCTIAIISNLAAGISDSLITGSEVKEIMSEKLSVAKDVISETIKILPEERDCKCHHQLDNAYL